MHRLFAIPIAILVLAAVPLAVAVAQGWVPEARLDLGADGSRGASAWDDGGGIGDDDDDEDDDLGPEARVALAEYFTDDPLQRPELVVSGDALDRLLWQADAPAYPGDPAGSLTARYDATAPAGLVGFPLGDLLDQDDTFVAAASFVIASDGFAADPGGFFQISWGLWNSATTGLERTGNFDSFATDTFELIEFDFYPNVSPFFGGPFLAPTLFGAADPGHPDFPFSGAFANFTTLFGLELALPLDVPLLALIEHRPDLDVMVLQVYEIRSTEGVVPLGGGVGVLALALPQREYAVDTAGLTLWHDGFSGPAPSVLADVAFHALVVIRDGLAGRPEELLDVETD